MISAVVGCGSIKRDGNVLIGSGSGIESEGASSSCGCGFSIKIISWQECDTVSKKIGFVFGQVINFMISLVTKACRFISKTINILYIDKLFEVFYRIIKGVLNKLYDLSKWMFENCIKPFFINKITKQMVEIIKEVSYRFNDYLIAPICKLIRKILPQVLNTTKVRADVAVQDSKIAKIFKNFLSAIKTGLTTIFNWTLVPVCNRALLPIFNVIGDILVGIMGGFSQKRQTSQEETPDLLNGR